MKRASEIADVAVSIVRVIGLSVVLPLLVYCSLSFFMPYEWPVVFSAAVFVGLVLMPIEYSLPKILVTVSWYVPAILLLFLFLSARLPITGFVFEP